MAKFITAKTKYDVANGIITDTIKHYIMDGYTICTQSMRGTQGETARVDLINEAHDTVIRVYAMNKYCSVNYMVFDEHMQVITEMFKVDHPVGPLDTLWNGDGTTIEAKHIMVKLDGNVVVMSNKEYEEMEEKHKKRIESRASRQRIENLTDDRLITTLAGLVRAQKEPGFKRFKLNDVARAERWVKGPKCTYFLKFTNGKSVKMKHHPDGGMVYHFGA